MQQDNTNETRPAAARGQAPDIYRAIRERICLLRYPPGTVLAETELAREFEVSRTPVRQALQRLEYEGLTEIRNGVGTLVTGLDPAVFDDIYSFRLRLSEMIGDFGAADAIPASLATVKALLPRARKLKLSKDLEAFWRANHELHHAVNRLIANGALRETHDRYYFLASRVWYSAIDRIFSAQITDLVEELEETRHALEIGDLRAVGYIQRNHIAFGLRRVATAQS